MTSATTPDTDGRSSSPWFVPFQPAAAAATTAGSRSSTTTATSSSSTTSSTTTTTSRRPSASSSSSSLTLSFSTPAAASDDCSAIADDPSSVLLLQPPPQEDPLLLPHDAHDAATAARSTSRFRLEEQPVVVVDQVDEHTVDDDEDHDNDNDDPPWMTVYYFPHAGGSAESALSWWTTTTTTTTPTTRTTTSAKKKNDEKDGDGEVITEGGGSGHGGGTRTNNGQDKKSHPKKKKFPYAMYVVALPGRGRRLAEEPPVDLETLAQLIASELAQHCSTPAYMLWGHSFGALLAARVAAILQQQQKEKKKPSLLLVSAHPFGNDGPQQVDFYRTLHHTATTTTADNDDNDNDDEKQKRDAVLLQAIERFGLLSATDHATLLSAAPTLREFVLAPLRTDLALAEQFDPQLSTTGNHNNIPVLPMGGMDDPWCPVDTLAASWQKFSTSPTAAAAWSKNNNGTTPLTFPGGHFYYLENQINSRRVQNAVEDIIQSVMVDEFFRPEKNDNAAKLLSILSGPAVVFPPTDFVPLHYLLERQALATPDRIAIEDTASVQKSWTYRQARREAHCLVRLLNVQPGDIVGLALPTCADSILVQWAILLAGAAICPIDVGRTSHSGDRQLASTSADHVPPPLVLPFAGGLACIVTTAAHASRLPHDSTDRIVLLDRKDGGSWLDAFVPLTDDRCLIPPADWPPVSLDDLAYVTTTSGTTGRPKVVRNVHRGATTCVLGREMVLPYDDVDDHREGLNVFFVWECLRPLVFGRTAVVIPDTTIYDPHAIVACLKKERIHRFMINPALMTNMLEQFPVDLKEEEEATKIRHGESLSSSTATAGPLGEVKHVFLEGEVAPTNLVRSWFERFPHITVWNIYSTWESLDVSMCNLTELLQCGDEMKGAAPVGILLPNVAAYIVDSSMRIVPRGVAGELVIAGPGISLGYDDSDQTALKFRPNPFVVGGGAADHNDEKKDEEGSSEALTCYSTIYKSGDQACIRNDGILTVMGRIDSQMVKIRAFKVYLNSVEDTILQTAPFTGVSAALVVPQLDPNTKLAQSLAAYLVFQVHQDDNDRNHAARQVHEFLLQNLPEYAVPSFYVSLKQFPIKAGSGHKMDKAALPDPTKFAVDIRSAKKALVQESFDGEEKRKMVKIVLEAMQTVLESKGIGYDDNFFHYGGHSLRAASLVGTLTRKFGISVTVIDVYNNPTASQLSALLDRSQDKTVHNVDKKPVPRSPRSHNNDPVDIAIVGMEGRFPGAASVDEFWVNVLMKGATAARTLSKQELKDRGVLATVYENPSWVPVAYALNDVDKFDAHFWGIGKEEAEMMDPQHRVFMETVWAAIENAGYAPRTGTPERTGVFAACGIDGYLHHHLRGGGLSEPLDPASLFLTEIGNEKDYISSRVSFGLDLLGPSVTVTSACSSGLSAVIQGANSLASMETDMAIAGASSITFPNFGYLYSQGLVAAQDGIVRPFDQNATGTVFGDSVGCVVMKRLCDAERDDDNILAVLKGWGQSNDGRQKAGFAAPSAYGQSLSIEDAVRMSKVDPSSISYVECHATATTVGDGIEILGLLDAYERLQSNASTPGTKDRQKRIALGSVKGNIGHANAAAGITGLIKTIMMLKEQTIVPTANLLKVSTNIEQAIAKSPFYILSDSAPHRHSPDDPHQPFRAGVSSFGIGGSNAHCVLEAYHSKPNSKQIDGPWKFGSTHLFTLSAVTEESLLETMEKCADHFRNVDDAVSKTSVAFTSQVARDPFKHRFSCSFRSLEDISVQLRKSITNEGASRKRAASKPSCTVALVFPGQGSQYRNMGRDLFNSNPLFRQNMRRCANIAEPLVGFDLLCCMYDSECRSSHCRTSVVHLSLFSVEYSMAQLLLAAGLRPVAVSGHSVGEITAAVVSGILSLPDAIKIIAVRSRECDRCKIKGSMLAVALPAADILEELGDNLWLALINSPKDCVVGGAASDIESLRQKLSRKGVQSKLLDVSNAFHTPMMKEASMAVVDALSIEPPLLGTARIPITSNVTGRWLHDEMCDPSYWGDHLCQTVHWSSNMQCLLAWEPDLVIEVGPGSTLSTLLERTLTDHRELKCFRSMRSANSSADDNDWFVDLLGDLWNEGCALDFEPLYPSKRRTVLPTYSFQKASFWANPCNSIYVSPTSLPKVSGSVNVADPDDAAFLVPISSPENGVGDVTYRMYCFAFAGGSWRSFEDWQSEGLDLHVIAVDSQGAGYTAESTITSIANLICEDSGPTDRIIFCGFSFGALRAVEVFKKLPSHVQKRVVLMCAAGRSPPHSEARDVTLSNLDIDSCSLAPPEVRESELWKSFFLPRLMRDLQQDADAYNRICASLSDNLWERMDCEVMVCCGTSDPTFHPSDAYRWASITSGPTSVELFPGDHSFLVEQSRQIFKRICKKVAGSLAPVNEVPFSYSIEWQRLTSKQVRPDLLPEISFRYTSVSDSMIDLPADMEERLSSSEDHLLFVLVVGKGNPEKQAWSVIDLMKKIVGRNSSGTLEVIMICRGTADGALVGGASKSISFEFPRISCRRVFIHDDANSPFVSDMDLARAPQTFSCEAPAWVEKVTKLCLQSDETDLWLKSANNGRFRVYAPRLRPLKSDCFQLAQKVDKLGHRRPGDFILISGGSGGIGSILVKWLISEQSVSPDKIVVLSRRRIASANGERVVVIGPADNSLKCQDLVDLDDVAAIFHLAGVVDDAIVPNTTLESFQRVKQAKADLASALMGLVTELGWEPEFLCNFSSTSSLFGFPGQTSYCAANSYLDGQAAAADADFQSPCPVITVNWGPWAEVGLSKVGSKAYQTALEAGDRPLTNREALLAFSHVIRSHDSHQFAVCNTDWGKSIWRDSPLLRDIVSTRRDLHVSGVSGQSTPTSVIPDTTTLWPASFEDIIESFLKAHVSSWLPDETLVALGVDSLDMVRMSNAFERKFGRAAPLSTFVQRGLTLRALARDLRNVLV